jgi:hypothetical protein
MPGSIRERSEAPTSRVANQAAVVPYAPLRNALFRWLLVAALERALAFNGPALVDVVTDPNGLAMPPKATIQQAKGFALVMTKMAFTGEFEDVLDTVMANWRELG